MEKSPPTAAKKLKLTTDGIVAVFASISVDFAPFICCCGIFNFVIAVFIAGALTANGETLMSKDVRWFHPVALVASCASHCARLLRCAPVQTGYEWTVATEPGQQKTDMWVNAKKLVSASSDVSVPMRTEMDEYGATQFLFSWKDTSRTDSIFTSANVQTMCRTEAVLTGDSRWGDYCQLNLHNGSTTQHAHTCAAQPMSVVDQIYTLATGTASNWQVKNCTYLTQAEVDVAVAAMIGYVQGSNALMKSFYGFFMEKDAPTSGKTDRTRSMISSGAPLAGFSSAADRQLEQQVLVEPFYISVQLNFFKFFGMLPPEDLGGHSADGTDPVKGILIDQNYYYNIKAFADELEVKFFNIYIWGSEWTRLLYSDLAWVLIMMIYVYTYMCFHTGSFYLATLGFAQIVASLPMSYVIYRGIFGIELFTIANVLVIFLIMGIGADDLFVLVDGYKQGESEMKLRLRAAIALEGDTAESYKAKRDAEDAKVSFFYVPLHLTRILLTI
jgi:hypothetical protein